MDFDSLVAQASSSLVLCSPFVSRGPCERVKSRVARCGSNDIQVSLLTDLSRRNILSGATDIVAIADLARAIPTMTIRFLPSLHAKVYIADDKCAIVTSGNLTDGGLLRNLEYGVRFTESVKVVSIKQDVLDYALLGSPIETSQLEGLASAAIELRELQQSAERAIRNRLRREFDRRIREVDEDLLRMRTAGRTAHAIFADAILHLLRKRPMSTTEINREVQRIHPDLCDDTIDRVIDGQHFGKLWKHGVRTAQVFLRRRGDIRLEDKLWRLRD
jgi:phosphatidylserine/phosphatidylglycerophosphate/cardiolipin synthase-like enzyme